jgi:hypothetical protein
MEGGGREVEWGMKKGKMKGWRKRVRGLDISEEEWHMGWRTVQSPTMQNQKNQCKNQSNFCRGCLKKEN